MILIGAKIGFMQNFIKIASFVFGFLFALLFATTFAKNCLYPTFGDSLKQTFYNNMIEKPEIQALSTTEGLSEALTKMGFPSFIANSVAANVDVANIPESVSDKLSYYFAYISTVIISFLVLWIGTTIICLLLKLFVKLLRRNKAICVFDGIFGAVFLLFISYVAIEVVFLFLMLIVKYGNAEGLNQYIINDMHPGMSPFRISGFLYNHNIIGNFFSILF